MERDISPTTAPDDPASAFIELRGEVSLLRRAIEGLTAERQNAPDYTPTLKAYSGRLAQIEEHLGRISESPAMGLTPENFARSMARVSETARDSDRDTIKQAIDTLQASIASINGVVEQAWTADLQWSGFSGRPEGRWREVRLGHCRCCI